MGPIEAGEYEGSETKSQASPNEPNEGRFLWADCLTLEQGASDVGYPSADVFKPRLDAFWIHM